MPLKKGRNKCHHSHNSCAGLFRSVATKLPPVLMVKNRKETCCSLYTISDIKKGKILKKEYLILIALILLLSAYLIFNKENTDNNTLPQIIKMVPDKIM